MKLRPVFLLITFTVLSVAGFGQAGISPSYVGVRMSNVAEHAAAEGALTPAAIRTLERSTFQLINSERAMAGLSPLRWSEKVADVARLHSNNMAEKNFFSHKGLDGLMVDDRAAQLDMGPWKAIGENIAFMKGYQDPTSTAVEKWLQSPSHKRNLLDPSWTETAIGLAVTADGKYYFTQVFIRN